MLPEVHAEVLVHIFFTFHIVLKMKSLNCTCLLHLYDVIYFASIL